MDSVVANYSVVQAALDEIQQGVLKAAGYLNSRAMSNSAMYHPKLPLAVPSYYDMEGIIGLQNTCPRMPYTQ